jgi:cytochrome c peroxidase
MRSITHSLFLFMALSAVTAPYATTAQGAGSGQPVVLAPFYSGQEYLPPEPGTYELPALGQAADGAVLDSSGQAQRLSDYLGDGKVVLLSFIYSHCTDVNGCPLSTAVLYSIQQKIKDDPWLRKHFRMISLSFDPTYDTPEVMKLYGANFRKDGDWRFLTTSGRAQLQPILQGYHQSVIRDRDAEGKELPSFSHILRVFLIDPQKRIRNIYSVSFLYPELIINDIKTVLMDGTNIKTASMDEAESELKQVSKLSHPGDYKEGYETGSYETRSEAVDLRKGEPADLLSFVENPPLGLPAVPQPRNNSITRDKVELGRKLFFDRRLSLNHTFSCAMCHIPEQGFTSNELATAVGVEGRSVRRNSPTLYNVAYMTRLFHDGREDTLEQQIWAPLLAHNEMANPAVGSVMREIRGLPEYRGLFEQAFDGRGLSMETLGMALASYERVLVSGDSPFDRWHYGGDSTAVSAAAKRGFELFTGKAGCSSCHTVGKDSALFTDNGLHNTGTGYRESMGIRPDKEKVVIAPGVTVEVEREIIDAVALPPLPDLGLYEVTQNPSDRWKYRTPGLRNVALTAPYMHNGSLGTLHEVVEFYNGGGVPNELQDPRIRPLGLSEREVDELVAFLESLTGNNVDVIVADAFAAPVGDITKADPHWAHDVQTVE